LTARDRALQPATANDCKVESLALACILAQDRVQVDAFGLRRWHGGLHGSLDHTPK
jgi:hypothetical protein